MQCFGSKILLLTMNSRLFSSWLIFWKTRQYAIKKALLNAFRICCSEWKAVIFLWKKKKRTQVSPFSNQILSYKLDARWYFLQLKEPGKRKSLLLFLLEINGWLNSYFLSLENLYVRALWESLSITNVHYH